jgi:hypothetical protein
MVLSATTINELTVSEKILLGAHALEDTGQSPFSAEALIVSAWQKFPQAFGLKGYADQYPDSNKVLSSIMGEKGLAKRGWLIKMGQKMYALSREGKQVVRRLQQGDDQPVADFAAPSKPVKLSKELDKALLALFASTACQKFEEGRQQELAFADACRFWGITENLHGDALDARLDHMEATLAQAERLIGLGSATLSNGRSISLDDTERLSKAHGFLEQRFSRHLTLLRNRLNR